MVFLRPIVIRTPEDSNALSIDRYDLIRAQQQSVGQPRQSVIMPINGAPVAPPLRPGRGGFTAEARYGTADADAARWRRTGAEGPGASATVGA